MDTLPMVRIYNYSYMSLLWWIFAIAFIVYRITQFEYFDKVRKTIGRDITGLKLLIKVKWEIRRRLNANRPIHEIFLEQVRKHPHKVACVEIETGREVTYLELNQLLNKYANYFDIGVISAFINSNLKLEPLAHSINVAKSRCIITNTSLLPILNATFDAKLLTKGEQPVYLASGESTEYIMLPEVIKNVSTTEPSSKGVDFQSVLCYVYTSGTTGNPKPAVIKHFRYYWLSMGSGNAFGIRPDDIVYITMPLYHSAAGIMGIGSIICFGTTAVIRKKFSATNFWKDCVKYNCTASQYIGEICRYLLAQKPCDEEKNHKVRMMWGNGLRAEIRPQFVNRFGLKRIGELYGSTEGNSNIVDMSLLDLSDKSKLRVFEVLGDRMSTIAQLRRVGPQFNIIAVKYNFDKVNAVHVIFQVSRADGEKWTIRKEIERVKPMEEAEYIIQTKKAKKTDNNGYYIETRSSDPTYRAILEINYDYNKMLKEVNRRLKVLFEKVKSLTIQGLNITRDIVKKLSTWKEKISMVKKLKLSKGDCTLTNEEFTKLMKMFSLTSFELSSFTTRNPIIRDCTNISLEERYAHHPTVLQCPGITNESLKYWMTNTPNTLNLANARTSFTFEAVWEFIQFVSEKCRREMKGPTFCFGHLDRNDENIASITKAMKKRNYKWKDVSYLHENVGLLYEVTYPIEGLDESKEGVKFTFSI